MATNFTPSSKMDALMAGLSTQTLSFNKGDQVNGKVILVTKSEVVIDLGGKAEGVLSRRSEDSELTEKLESIKEGDRVDVFVAVPETKSGQIVLSLTNPSSGRDKSKRSPFLAKKWAQLKSQVKSNPKLSGEVLEQNKGGFVVNVEDIRGFLPSSQISLDILLSNPSLVGSTIPVRVIEIDESDNRLVLTTRAGNISSEKLDQLNKFNIGDKVKGVIKGVFPFGLILDLGQGLEGLVKVGDLAWERVEDPNTLYQVDQEIEAQVMGVDAEVGRVNLSIKSLTEDPFKDLAENYQIDDVISGVVTEITQSGVKVSLKDGVEGFISPELIDPSNPFTLGESKTFLVSSVDQKRRVVNLAPFITSMSGLIYK